MNSLPFLRYDTTEALARAVYRHCREARPPVRHLLLRPSYGGYWWLVPSERWPAYQHSKLLFHRVREAPDCAFAGFCVEKGLGRQQGDLVPARLIMEPHWAWYDFLNLALGGVLDAPLREVQAAGMPLFVSLDLYRGGPERVDLPPDDRVAFAARGPGLALEVEVAAEAELAPFNGAVSLPELAGRAMALPAITWYWITWRIGARLRYTPAGSPPPPGAWGAAELWRGALEPWLRWVR